MLMALAAGVTAVSNAPVTSLRRAAGAPDGAALAELLNRLELDAALVDADCDESGRSALHHACWRGSVRNVERLLDLGCDIDAWSTGLHSYGKTPIFYATTRCRDDVVELLVSRGARLRILNNKGQSVLSLASTHLSPRALAAVEEAEAAEGELPPRWVDRLRALPPAARPLVCAAGWVDFQTSHPDRHTYGDLDPRFYFGAAHPDGRKYTEPDGRIYLGEGGGGDPLFAPGPHAVVGSRALDTVGEGPELHTARGADVVTRLAVNPTSREGRRLHKHLPGAQSLAWFPPATGGTARGGAEGGTAGGGAGGGTEGGGAGGDTAGGGAGVYTARVSGSRRRKSGHLATGRAPVGAVGRPGGATSAAVLAAALDEALTPLLQLLGGGGGDGEGGGGGDGEMDGVEGSATPVAVAELASSMVAVLALHKGAWLTAAALRIGRSGAPPSLLRAAAMAAAEPGGSHSHLCRRMLLQAAHAPSEEEAEAAAEAETKAAAERRHQAAARAVALAHAETRRVARLTLTLTRDAPAPRVVWVNTSEGVRAMEAVLGQALFVGVDTEWKDARSGGQGGGEGSISVGEAVLAAVQLAVNDGEGGEVAYVCDVPWVGEGRGAGPCWGGVAEGVGGGGEKKGIGDQAGGRNVVAGQAMSCDGGASASPQHRTGVPALQLDAAYAPALAGALHRLLVRSAGPRVVGFAFSADAQKISRWMHAVGGGAWGSGGGGVGGGGNGHAVEDINGCDGDVGNGGDVVVSGCSYGASGTTGSEASVAAAIARATVDVQRLAEQAGLGSRAQAPSLQAACQHWLAHRLSKQEQCSDWGVRPLSERQMRYAATDASACLRLLAAMRADWGGAAGVPLDEGL